MIINSCLLNKMNVFNKCILSKVPRNNFKSIAMNYVKLNTNIKIALYHNTKAIPKMTNSVISKKVIGTWLLTCSGMVFIAVSLGGITRLTESGLSMVTWRFLGEKMPYHEVDWINEFEKYKQFPEYQITNKDMTLQEFKRIWWMEYMHRMWGRLIGAAFIIPAGYFWMTNKLQPSMKRRVLVLGALIGCQGLMGWYMVKSGLENKFDGPSDVPRVSQYRLAAHLGLAITIYAGFLYSALDHLLPNKNNFIGFTEKIKFNLSNLRRFKYLVYSSKGLIFLTAISGAFVAGLDAGLIYNTFPKMSNKWIPDDLLFLEPVFRNFTENATTVQFNHRILGILTLTTATCIGLLSRKYKLSGRLYTAAITVLSAAYLQATLGILTLVNCVPTYLAALHQSGSLLLFSSIIWLCHELKHLRKILK